MNPTTKFQLLSSLEVSGTFNLIDLSLLLKFTFSLDSATPVFPGSLVRIRKELIFRTMVFHRWKVLATLFLLRWHGEREHGRALLSL